MGKLRLVLASRNKGKLRELEQLLEGLGFEIVLLDAYEGLPDIPETGSTFRENAVIKAAKAAELTGTLCLADDSGLEVDFLDGAPGVYSSRFAGEAKDDWANNQKLLELLDGVPEPLRTARFKSVVAVANPEGRVETVEGVCEGVIGTEPRGSNGFGYDPLFVVKGQGGKTMAELEPEVKNRISHRAMALRKAAALLETFASKD